MLNVRIFHTNIQFGSFYYVHVTRKKAAEMTFVRKMLAFYVDEIDTYPREINFRQILNKTMLHNSYIFCLIYKI